MDVPYIEAFYDIGILSTPRCDGTKKKKVVPFDLPLNGRKREQPYHLPYHLPYHKSCNF